MSRKLRWEVVVLGLALFGPGCGEPEQGEGSSGGTGGAATNTSTGGAPGNFEGSLAEAFCARLFRCALANDDDIGTVASLGTEQRCVEMVVEVENRDPRVLDLRTKLGSGAVHFVSDRVPACLAEARSCDFAQHAYNLTRSGPACRAVFEGTVPIGGACQRYEECAGDARCVVDQSCPGTCVARAKPGEPCDRSEDCDDSAGYVECRVASGAAVSTCVAIATATFAKEGEPCTASVSEVQSVLQCADGLWCDTAATASPSAGICRSPIAAGGSCDDIDDLCVKGYTCFDRVSCKPAQVGARVGEPCSEDDAGAFCDPFARLACVSGKCQTLGDGTPGSACSMSDIHELLDCQRGLRCAGPSPGTCAPPLTADEACLENSDCASGTCANGKCAATFCASR